jgi:hypothetical protein
VFFKGLHFEYMFPRFIRSFFQAFSFSFAQHLSCEQWTPAVEDTPGQQRPKKMNAPIMKAYSQRILLLNLPILHLPYWIKENMLTLGMQGIQYKVANWSREALVFSSFSYSGFFFQNQNRLRQNVSQNVKVSREDKIRMMFHQVDQNVTSWVQGGHNWDHVWPS